MITLLGVSAVVLTMQYEHGSSSRMDASNFSNMSGSSCTLTTQGPFVVSAESYQAMFINQYGDAVAHGIYEQQEKK